MTSPESPVKPVIGIVGGIGAGKSSAAAEFVALGCALIDADKVGHDLLADPAVLDQIRERWGEPVLAPDGDVSRPALAKVVFASPAELDALNAILHPPMRRRMRQLIDQARADKAVTGVVLDAAVLFEAGWDDLCTHVVFVSAPAADRLQRVLASRGWNETQWESREKAQFSLDSKAARCDYTVDNRFGASFLREQVRVIFHRIRPEE